MMSASNQVKSGIKIENMIASTSVEETIDLNHAAALLEGSEYDPEHFAGVIVRLKKPKSTVLIFKSGKLVSTGAKGFEGVEAGINMLDRLHVPVPTNQVEDVQMGTYVDTFGRSASIILIRYPDHDSAFNRLESLKVKGATQTEIMPLTAPMVYSITDGNSVQYFYVKKSTLYVVELNGVEFETLTSAIINI